MVQAIVQLHGEVNITQDVRDTLTMLSTHHVDHATFVPKTGTYRRMIPKVNDSVVHSESNVDVVETLTDTRAESEEDDDDITDEWVPENTDYDDMAVLAQATVDEETTLREQDVFPVIHLHPPHGGHRGQKHVTKGGGQPDKHSTEQIDKLLEDMQ